MTPDPRVNRVNFSNLHSQSEGKPDI